jgi:hypothetical protein
MVASLLLPVTASAEIGASDSPVTTPAPDLRSATVVDVADKKVRVCYDQPPSSIGGTANLYKIAGYNDTVVASGTGIGAAADPDCVVVDFDNSASDITQYTILTVQDEAATNAGPTNSSVGGAVALENINLGPGGLPGRTTGPDLTNAAKDTAPGLGNDVLYTHDEILSNTPGDCDSTKFGFWKTDGTPVMAAAASCSVAPNSTVARVSFLDTTGAVRFFELEDAVLDRGGDMGTAKDSNTIGSTLTGVPCETPPGPPVENCTADLTAVNRPGGSMTEVDYTFDLGGTPSGPGGCDSTKFFVFEEDTTQHPATACDVRSLPADPQTVVRATFPSTANFSPFETPSAGVLDNAFVGGPANTHGARPLGTSREASGFTDAPDLEDADFDTSLNQITFNYDENVDPATAMAGAPGDHCVFTNDPAGTPAGTTAPACTGTWVSTTNNQVVMQFTSSEINTAVGAQVIDLAVADYGSNQSFIASVGQGPAPSAGTIQFGSPTFSVNENGGTATITVTRNGGSDGAASVNYSTSNGSATNADYTNVGGTLNWANGDSSTKSFNVPITDDFLGEGNETVNLSLSGASGAALGSPSAATLTIIDNDSTGALSFTGTTYSVGEGAGSALITVQRTGGTSGTATVQYSTSNGSAVAGSDYSAVSGTLTFGNGVSSQTFTVPITQDTLVEGNETVNLSIFSPGGGASVTSPTSAVLTIVDDDTSLPGTLAFASATHTVAENAGSQLVTVNRTGGSTGTVTVGYSTIAGTATAGSDYTVTNGTLTFLAGETSKTFSVPILNDTLDESAESFTLVLSGPTGGAVLGSPSTSAVTITDDDLPAPGTVESGISISYRNRTNRFKGRVSAPSAGTDEIRAVCRNDREVALHKVNRGTRGTTFTGPRGKWSIFKNNPRGGWFAVVRATGPRTLSDGSSVICARGESSIIFP